jgi:murein DD-endopeptidase MepM/ murein hydrolase activator NlpD
MSDAPVRVIFEGEVRAIGGEYVDKIYVLVKHGNYFTVYQNLTDITVKRGDKVKLKQTIGKVYTEKGADRAVLHFEIWEENKIQNPENWIVKNKK